MRRGGQGRRERVRVEASKAHLPRTNADADDASRERVQQPRVLRRPLHPRPPLVVDEHDGDLLRGLDQKHDRVE